MAKIEVLIQAELENAIVLIKDVSKAEVSTLDSRYSLLHLIILNLPPLHNFSQPDLEIDFCINSIYSYDHESCEMDTKAIEMLTKGLFIKKRKKKASSDSLKRMKVGICSSTIPTSTTITPEVIASVEVALTAEVGTTSVGSMPPMSSGPSKGDRALEPPTKGEIGKERKKKKTIAKTSQMDTKAIEMLTKGLFIKKRKKKASSDSLKRMKVGICSSTIPTSTTITPEVIASVEVALTAEVGTTSVGSMPPMSSGPSKGDRALEPPTKGEIGKERKKKKTIAKTSRKARLSGSDGDSDE
ncbi:hypothetical protein COCNU_scaffold003310G000010 [Cocos nucifera]|nr:hypothetical protein [Cocos nucifera]